MASSRNVDLFRIKNLTKVYGNHYVFNNMSFNIHSGEILGVVARSGTGKTTFLNMLIGLVQPDRGEILFRDMHLMNLNAGASFRKVTKQSKNFKHIYGFAAQNPSFYPSLTAWENLLYFGALYNIPRDSLRVHAENLLKLVDLSQAKNVIAKNMSGGMKRRLDIACSLIHDPKLLILDEPTADLDPVLSNKIWNILRIINQKGTTIILASHHVIELEHLCDRIVIFKDGNIAALGRPDEIKSKNVIEESIYLRTSPGNYSKVMKKLKKETLKHVQSHRVEDEMLIIDAVNTSEVIRDLIVLLEKLKEDVIDIEFRKPTLDKIFIEIDKGTKAKAKTDSKGTSQESKGPHKGKKKHSKSHSKSKRKAKERERKIRRRKKHSEEH